MGQVGQVRRHGLSKALWSENKVLWGEKKVNPYSLTVRTEIEILIKLDIHKFDINKGLFCSRVCRVTIRLSLIRKVRVKICVRSKITISVGVISKVRVRISFHASKLDKVGLKLTRIRLARSAVRRIT